MDPPSSPGQPLMIIGRYALFEALAAGGMATVHLGRLLGPAGFSRTVAIKRLHEQFAADPEFVAGFLDEARLAGRIRHPNVVPTLDVVAAQGQLFLVMEYVQGESLARIGRNLRKRHQVMPLRIAIATMVGALHGLHAAHEARSERGESLEIVHRDVSPHNILLGTDGVARVLDFGVAKAIGRLQSTESGRLKGKVSYMSPEQVRSGTIDRRTDIFAASIVLWELLTGERLFDAEHEGAALERVLYSPIPPPSRYSAEIPPRLDEVILRGLERDVERRWQTARDMALALEDCVPPPSPAQVGAWVEKVASEQLTARAHKVAQIESATSDPGIQASQALAELRSSPRASEAELRSSPQATQVLVPGGLGEPQTGSRSASTSLALSNPPTNPRARALAWILVPTAVLALLGLAVAVTVFVMRERPQPAAASAASAPVPSLSEAVPAAAEPEPSASAAPAEVPRAAQPEPPAASAKPVPPKKGGAFKPAVDCSVPYVRDELGRKIWKKECL